jgi:hypothetical protein
MKLLPIDAAGVRRPESASLSDEEFGKHVGMLKGWFLDERGCVYEKSSWGGEPQPVARSLSELGLLLRMLPEPAVSAGRDRSVIFWTRIPEAAKLQRLSRGLSSY